MKCETNPCLSLIESVLNEHFKKDSNKSNIEDASMNFFYFKKYFVILKDPSADTQYYLRRVKAHMDELDNYLSTNIWKRMY